MSEVSFATREIHVTGFRVAAMQDGIEIGHAYVYRLDNDGRDSPFALAEDLYVIEPARRQGIARLLAAESIKMAKKLGCYKLIASSRFSREGQHRRLESYGLKKWGYEFRLDFEGS
ncbi:GNAT family N-acetyltransferase [Streptomyces roseoverticillatus]|uniref:GNAT family N-acetyltransferase n=1 Tax=Streptomyces roseoverticillatus TaxID=66429 RepID=A0ABV3IXN6_9ACTN